MATKMEQNQEFYQLVEQGIKAIEQGRYSKLEDVKRRLGDV